MSGIIYGLRIKKKYFDEIISGRKTSEYRSLKDRYRRLLDKERPIKYLLLHYQDLSRRAIVEVKEVDIIDCPESLKDSQIQFTSQVIEIKLGKCYIPI